MTQKVNQLYGLKIGDNVRYIENNERLYDDDVFNTEGVITNIIPQTGEFHVKIEKLDFEISFQRFGLLLLEDNVNNEIVDFEGQLANTLNMSSGEMRSYLDKYHSLKEGKDFSISDREDKEVVLSNEKYALLLKELFAIEGVTNELGDSKIRSFKHTMKTNISSENGVSLTFKASDWTFRTHLLPWNIQYSLLLQYDINLYKEWGFNIV